MRVDLLLGIIREIHCPQIRGVTFSWHVNLHHYLQLWHQGSGEA